MPGALFDKHLPLLRQAMAAAENRVSWTPFPETPAHRGTAAIQEGREAFEAYRDASFYLDQPSVLGRYGGEVSPYGFPLNVSYPVCNTDALLLAARSAMWPWVKAGPEARIGVCMEILERLHSHGVELAYAVKHTSGQSFSFAYQHSVAHALDRGLESVACAYREMKQVLSRAIWTRHGAKEGETALEKAFVPAPHGVGLVITSATSPTWSSFPGLFANLATGNPVIIQPHPEVVLPLAITVAICRMTLKESGFDPNLVSLLVDDGGGAAARMAALKSEVRLIDFTGDRELGDWLEENVHHAVVFAQKASLNCVVVDSTDDYKGLLRNLAVTLSLYSGQLAGTPRLVLVSREGVRTPQGVVAADQFGRDLALALGRLDEDPVRAAAVLGCLQSEVALGELIVARESGHVLRNSAPADYPQWPLARCHTPMLVRLEAADPAIIADTARAPVCFLLETATATEALALAERLMTEHGAFGLGLHSTNEHVWELAEESALRLGIALHLNLTGHVLMNQPAAYADFHGAGANPAANCSFVDAAFVARRFFIVQTQKPAQDFSR